MKQAVLAGAALLALSFGASAQDFLLEGGDAAFYATATPIVVTIGDEVTGGCLTNTSGLKTAAELVFRRSGIEVADKIEIHTSEFTLSFLGQRVKSKADANLGCVVHASARLASLRPMRVPYLDGQVSFTVISRESGAVLLTGSGDQSGPAKDFTVSFAENAANAILKGRADLKAKFPDEYGKVAKGVGFRP